jgi:hypothetical protein
MEALPQFIAFITNHQTLLLACALFVVVCYALYLDHKVVTLTRGQNGASLEDVIKMCIKSVEAIEKRNELITNHAALLDHKMSHALRNAKTIRYKALEPNGSNQSFSVALVNEQGNGVILSTLHVRDRVNTFAKPITNYESEYDLTEEELAVLDDAREAHKSSV